MNKKSNFIPNMTQEDAIHSHNTKIKRRSTFKIRKG